MQNGNDIKYEFSRFDGASGEPYRRWRRELLNRCAGNVYESGSSLADHLLDVDMGGAGPAVPAMPTAAGEVSKMQRLRNGRARAACSVIIQHIADPSLVAILSANQFQRGQDALRFLSTTYDTMIPPSELRELDQLWNDLKIVNDVGIIEESINKFSKSKLLK